MPKNKDDDARRVELTPRQIRDLKGYIDTFRSEKATDAEAADAAGMAMGYLNSAIQRGKS